MSTYETLLVRIEDEVCRVQLNRPEAGNGIDERLVGELTDVLARCERDVTVVILEGTQDVFCMGADFGRLAGRGPAGAGYDPAPAYDLWLRLTGGPFVSIAHVRGRTNAGGIGFVAACDIAIADERATFSLSELLFGLMPACVLPFLVRRIGWQNAHYMTLTAQTVSAAQAHKWGLVDVCDRDSAAQVQRHLRRLQHLCKDAVARYKRYAGELRGLPLQHRSAALAANLEVFTDSRNLARIRSYVERGVLPWES